MLDHVRKRQEEIAKSISSTIGGTGLSEDELEKSANDYFEKGRTKHAIGEQKVFGGRTYIKTANGWKYHGKGKSDKAKENTAGALNHHVEAEQAKLAGISVEEYRKLHSGTKAELKAAADKDWQRAVEEKKGWDKEQTEMLARHGKEKTDAHNAFQKEYSKAKNLKESADLFNKHNKIHKDLLAKHTKEVQTHWDKYKNEWAEGPKETSVQDKAEKAVRKIGKMKFDEEGNRKGTLPRNPNKKK